MLASLLVVSSVLGSSSPAAADTNLAAGLTGYLDTSASGCGSPPCGPFSGSAAGLTDGNTSGAIQYGGNGFPSFTWAAVTVGTAAIATTYRIVFGSGGSCGTGINEGANLWASNTAPSGDASGYPTTAYTTLGALPTGVTGPDTGMVSVTNTNAYAYYGVRWSIASSDCRSQIKEIEIYAGAPAEVDGTDYIYGATMANGLFSKQIHWYWKLGFAGSWSIKRANDTDPQFCNYFSFSMGRRQGCYYTGGELGDRIEVEDLCGIGGCGGPWTLTIEDIVRDQTATYSFPNDGDGELVGFPPAIQITSFAACYNATAGQCGTHSGVAESVGTIHLRFAFTGPTANAFAGPRSPQASGTIDGDAEYVAPDLVPDVYEAFAIEFNPAKSHTWLLIVETTDHLSRAITNVDIRYDGGGTNEIHPPSPVEPCQVTDVACGFRSVVGEIFNVSAAAVQQAVSVSVNDVRSKIVSKQPFGFIARAFDGVSGQIGRAQDATATSSTCSGVTLTVPMPSPTAGYIYWPPSASPPVLVVLKCADIEPWGGTAWWQAIRTAMGPALYLGYAYGWMRKLQPKPVVAG